MKKCNQCGICCLISSCQVSQLLFDIEESTLCPALIRQEDKYQCGLIMSPLNYLPVGKEEWKEDIMRQWLIKLIGIGEGCSNTSNGGTAFVSDDGIYELLVDTIYESVRR